MKRSIVIAIVVAISGTAVSVATSAEHAVPAWPTSKTERMLVEGAKVQLPAPDGAALERELDKALLQLTVFAYAAAELGDSRAVLAYERAADEYRRALWVLRDGMDVAEADCVGEGRALAARRFRRFECLIKSGVLALPTTELASSADDALPAVVQRDPRQVGPFMARVHVRITGPTSFIYS
jgi:hypothetical protein